MLFFAPVGTMKGKELVVKSNRLVEAGYRLTLVEQRVILLAIAEARRTQKGVNGEDFVRITAQNYARQFESDENSAYLQLKEARKSLFNRQFVIYQADEESGHQEVMEARWLSAASYIDGAGAIRLQFSQAVVPYITRLEKEFTVYRLEKISKMSSAYAIRLYELLMQWGSVG
jgi:plasmid replication initiation protein